MKKKLLPWLLVVLVLVLLGAYLTGNASVLNPITVPFILAGMLLRWLSLSGIAGNLVSIALYLAIGLLPFTFKFKKGWHKEDLVLALSSVAVWYALYYFINPSLRPLTLGGEVGQFVLAGTVYSLWILWGILRLMKHYSKANADTIYQALEIFLLICTVERCCAVVTRFLSFLSSVKSIAAANTMPGLDLTATNVFLFLGFAVAATEYLFNAAAFYLGAKLTAQLRLDPYSKESEAASVKTVKLCRAALVTITATNAALNLLQVLSAPYLHSLAAQLHFPVTSIAVVFALLVLSSLLGKGRAIKEDNDLFI